MERPLPMASVDQHPDNSLTVVLDALERVGSKVRHPRPEQAWAQCPAHDDRSPSLTLRYTGDRVLLHCHAGCSTSNVLYALGLGWSALYDRPLDTSNPVQRHPRAGRYSVREQQQADHLLDRIAREQALEADPAYWDRRIAEAQQAQAKPGEYAGGPVAWEGDDDGAA